jgi:hypothetical protein
MITKFIDDRFDFVLRTSANNSGTYEWWVKCLDCPQKVNPLVIYIRTVTNGC